MWYSAIDWTMVSDASVFWVSMLVGSVVKVTILLAVVGLAMRVFSGASSAARHLIWFVSLAVLPALPALTLVVPTWGVLPDWPGSLPGNAQPIASRVGDQMSDDVTSAQPAPDHSAGDPALQPRSGTTNDIADASHVNRSADSVSMWRVASPFLLAVWLAGCLLTLAPWLVGTASLCLVEYRGERVKRGRLSDRLHQLCAKLAIHRRVQLIVSGQREMPMHWGVISPKVLLPSSSSSWTEDRLTAVLVHELSHVRRVDCATQLLATIVVALYWFHPMVWWVRREMKSESEFACDDMTLGSGCRATEYAQHVLYVAANSCPVRLSGRVAIGMARRSRLEERVRAILDRGRNRNALSVTGAVACCSLVLALASPLVLLGSKPPTDQAAGSSGGASHDGTTTQDERPGLPQRLGHVGESAEGKRSIAGSGHAVLFRRPKAHKYLMAVEIFASRYGTSEPPNEDFHVYLLDENQKLLRAFPFPYSMIERGDDHWYTLKLPACEVPRQFTVAVSFNPHRTKGIYLGFDKNDKQSHSYTGRPTTGYRRITEKYDWMVRAIVVEQLPTKSPFISAEEM